MQNNKKIIIFECCSFFLCVILSFIFHFLYDWTGGLIALAPILPTNESVWEHSKLIFMPYLIVSAVGLCFFKDKKAYIYAKLPSLAACVPIMICGFYTYYGILGKDYLAADIILTILTVAAEHFISYKRQLIKPQLKFNFAVGFSLAFTIIMFIALIVFTFVQPHIAVFLDTMTNTYGIA